MLKFDAFGVVGYENYVLTLQKIKGWILALAQEGILGCLVQCCTHRDRDLIGAGKKAEKIVKIGKKSEKSGKNRLAQKYSFFFNFFNI